jgi:DNA modification methylase
MSTIAAIETSKKAREDLFLRYKNKLEVAYNLNRKVVSFQANKIEPFFRWFKYKEGFSSSLVKHFLKEYGGNGERILDPFAGAGTALFTAQEMGWQSFGIELLPVGIFAMQARQIATNSLVDETQQYIKSFLHALKTNPDICGQKIKPHINHIAITKDAFSEETEKRLNLFLDFCNFIKDEQIRTLLRFVAFSVLEEVSYTRKDGQYLRWDYRSGRNLSGKPFDKGTIYSFEEALLRKLDQIAADTATDANQFLFDTPLRKREKTSHPITVIEGSSLLELPKLEDNHFDCVITSPPYCNRYDYTRTYALELVYLGLGHQQIRDLRQTMLSCTVENKEKTDQLQGIYQSLDRHKDFEKVFCTYRHSAAMSEINNVLDELNREKLLNNNNVPRMVKNYFFEMCFIIFELARITKSGGHCVMVNDNVRYGGEEIPVDLVLSEFAEEFGWHIEKILVLPRGKGNSSQQMGNYGRTEIRKSVYLWKKK